MILILILLYRPTACLAYARRKKGRRRRCSTVCLTDTRARLLIFGAIHVIAAYSFYLPYKTAQVSLGQADFMAIGAYASAILTRSSAYRSPWRCMFGGVTARA